uniref:Bifunctional protein FolD n=1 Tax=Candidatus Kentrum sp. TUN TaxID=2126343 RepID=A0A450ZQK7_9GAMM|nr:MAG: methenyltetrahydrofolate cyclohydrolase /5,10-methylenetetrahydrofolate dehydrogenase (NADP+) [Candidatus Kentron sp. TUN]VFK53998.1 MAG: methenyltetrahydrofolate cyclohydrolase /5,10-methylenetetrahydrofolate dehydrogenase (NADP+) [Candidatus Kentron sp. TUN]VFK56112.1 MAG: methenyltetrahydrofolate cyclohydrolase /5,10-methylenetetrahydrofolate dehydrogenase (NADP+) [Candidatus Kentron sp. TUN]
MSARLLDGKATAKNILVSLHERVVQRIRAGGSQPGLAVILVGEDPASQVYVRNKRRACEQVNIRSVAYDLPASVSEDHIIDLIDTLNENPEIHGILVQLPLPAHIDPEVVIERILPSKDVDGFHPYNVGRLALGIAHFRPCTPKGIMTLLEETNEPLKGRDAVIVGHSTIVGRPMSLELLAAECTVTICHHETRDLASKVKSAEILVVSVGKPGLIPGSWVRKGSIVIDVGINRLQDGKIVGDVVFQEAWEHAAWITPVPGGVGPMTVATLLANTLEAAEIGENR